MLRHDQPVTARGFQSIVVQYTLTYMIAWLVWIGSLRCSQQNTTPSHWIGR